jgi:hypothetical protein
MIRRLDIKDADNVTYDIRTLQHLFSHNSMYDWNLQTSCFTKQVMPFEEKHFFSYFDLHICYELVNNFLTYGNTLLIL